MRRWIPAADCGVGALGMSGARVSVDFATLEGEALGLLLGREIRYNQAYEVLHTSTSIWRAVHFAAHFDLDIGIPTIEAYRPAIPLTVEAGAYSCFGFCIGWLIVFIITGGRRRRLKPKD